MNTKEIGNRGEQIATNYLIRNGYQIIENNFWCKQGEIDIIAQDFTSKELVFVEVKTRTQKKYGSPIDAIDQHKLHHMYQAAHYYLYKENKEDYHMRFDAIEIYLEDEIYHLHHIMNCNT